LAGEYGEGMVLTAAYREFLSAIATSAGALTGLLFVAISAAPRRGSDDSSAVIQQVRAAAALVAFFNALAVSIFGLVPGGSVRYPAVALGIGGMLFTAAGIRSVLSARSTTNQRLGQLWLVVLLLLIFGTELVAGIILLADSGRSTPVELINYALATSLLVGVARAWELVGARDTGIIASLVILSRRAPGPSRAVSTRALDAACTAEDGGAAGHDHGDDGSGGRPGVSTGELP
jgi:hypothetical protein